MLTRMLRAAALDSSVYEEVEHDRSANGQAALVVVLASLAAGLGSVRYASVMGLLLGVVIALGSWLIWSGLTMLIGTRLFRTSETQADYGQLLRTIGFASSPGVIRVLGVVPFVAVFANIAAAVWMLMATVMAVRQALDYRSTWRAVAVVGAGWVIQLVIILIFTALVVGPTRPSPV